MSEAFLSETAWREHMARSLVERAHWSPSTVDLPDRQSLVDEVVACLRARAFLQGLEEEARDPWSVEGLLAVGLGMHGERFVPVLLTIDDHHLQEWFRDLQLRAENDSPRPKDWRREHGPDDVRFVCAEARRHVDQRLITAQALLRLHDLEVSPAPRLDAWSFAVLAAHPPSGAPFESPQAINRRIIRPSKVAEAVREIATRHRKKLLDLQLVERDPNSGPRHGRYRRTPAGDGVHEHLAAGRSVGR